MEVKVAQKREKKGKKEKKALKATKAHDAIPEGAGTKTIPEDGLPEQGYDGAGMPKGKVTHENMTTASDDWHNEYGHAKPKKAEKNSAGGGLAFFAATPKSIQFLAMVVAVAAFYVF